MFNFLVVQKWTKMEIHLISEVELASVCSLVSESTFCNDCIIYIFVE